MDDDLLILVSRLNQVTKIEDIEEVKSLGAAFLRKQKRMALLTLLAISEEMGDGEITESIQKMASYLEETRKNKP